MTEQDPRLETVNEEAIAPGRVGRYGSEDAGVEACWIFTWDYFEALLHAPEEHIGAMVEDFLVELCARPIHDAQIVANEFTSITAHVLEHMHDDRADFPLQAAIQDIVSLEVIDPDQNIDVVRWLAELRWRGAASRRFHSEDPVFREAMTGSTTTHPEVVDEAHVALGCALMAARSLHAPGTALETYLSCYEDP